MEITITNIIGAILIYWLRNVIKSKNLKGQINQLKVDIKYTKHKNPELHKALLTIYEGKVFELAYGFVPLNNRVSAYCDFINNANISISNFRAFFKQGYLTYNSDKDSVSLEITNKSKFIPAIYWANLAFLLACSILSLLTAKHIIEEFHPTDIYVIAAYTFLTALAILFYYLVINTLMINILPYYEAKRVIKKNILD